MTELLLRLFVRDYKNTKDPQVKKRYGLLGSVFGLITNLILFLAKIIIGVILNLFSIIADSVNNLSDFGNNAISIFGFKVTAKRADEEHPFGHQRMEYVISLIISCIIIALGAMMFYQGVLGIIEFVESMIDTSHPVIQSLSYTEYIASMSILSVAVFLKICQSALYYSLGKRIDSLQLKALGRDSLNDVIATSLVMIGVLITWFTSFSVDCFFTIAVAILVIISGVEILRQAADILIGKKADKEMINSLISLIRSHDGVLGIHDLTMHYYGQNIFAVIHVEVDAQDDIMVSHTLCDNIEKEALDKLGIHLTIHMDPILTDDPDTNKYRDAVSEALRDIPFRVTFHDFRIVSATDHVNLVFDVVIPTDSDDEEGRQEVKDVILRHTDMRYGKRVYLVIDFDDSSTDFLYGTEEENENNR